MPWKVAGAGRSTRLGAGVDAVGVVLGEIAHFAIVHVHVLAGRDGGGGEADDLAVAADRVRPPRWSDGDLVARPGCAGSLGRYRRPGARQQGGSGDHYVILGMQANDGRRGHGGFLGLGCRLLTASGR